MPHPSGADHTYRPGWLDRAMGEEKTASADLDDKMAVARKAASDALDELKDRHPGTEGIERKPTGKGEGIERGEDDADAEADEAEADQE